MKHFKDPMVMSNTEPIFIDQYAIEKPVSDLRKDAHADIKEGRAWKLAWQGHIPLWKAFWIYFILGHGALFGLGCGFLVFSLLAGNFLTSISNTSIAGALSIAGVIVSLIYVGFAFWAVVTVWRNSRNCNYKRHGVYAKIIIGCYIIAIVSPVLWYLTG